jgi:hypothetical protein
MVFLLCLHTLSARSMTEMPSGHVNATMSAAKQRLALDLGAGGIDRASIPLDQDVVTTMGSPTSPRWNPYTSSFIPTLPTSPSRIPSPGRARPAHLSPPPMMEGMQRVHNHADLHRLRLAQAQADSASPFDLPGHEPLHHRHEQLHGGSETLRQSSQPSDPATRRQPRVVGVCVCAPNMTL